MTLAERLNAVRESLTSPTSKALADLLGVEQPTANRWLNNKAIPSPDNVPRIAAVLGIDLEEAEALIARTRRQANRANGALRQQRPVRRQQHLTGTIMNGRG